MTCATQDNFALLQLAGYTFIIDQTDVEIDFPNAADISVVNPQGILFQLSIVSRIVTFNLLGSNDPNSTFPPMLTDAVVNNISNFRKTQYNAVLNGLTPPYVQFDGYNATFDTGIITEITPVKGLKVKVGNSLINVYDSITLKVTVVERSWL